MTAALTLALFLLCGGSTRAAPPARPTPVPPPRVTRAQVQSALDRADGGPTVAAVQRAALRRAALEPRTTKAWLRRVRAAALLPTVMGQADLRSDQAFVLDQEAGTADALQQDLAGGSGFRVRATWQLDRLIFNPDELRAARAGLDVLDWRRSVLEDVTRLYFERRQLLVELALLGPGAAPLPEIVGRELRVREVEALLTGLTGLTFRPAGPRPPPAQTGRPRPSAAPNPAKKGRESP